MAGWVTSDAGHRSLDCGSPCGWVLITFPVVPFLSLSSLHVCKAHKHKGCQGPVLGGMDSRLKKISHVKDCGTGQIVWGGGVALPVPGQAGESLVP